MFFPPPREPFPSRMCTGLFVQPTLSLSSPPVKTLPLLDAVKKSGIAPNDPRFHLRAAMPSYSPSLYDVPYHPNRRIQDMRVWSHIDSRLMRLNHPAIPITQQTTGNHPLITRAPYYSSPYPHFNLGFNNPTNYGRKFFRCPQCRYVTDRRNNLKRHVLTMHQTCQKMLECCGIMFSTKASLREHSMIFHCNGYTCHFCGRRFCRKALLKRHLSVHSGQKDYTCAVCDYATSHKSNLERHRKVHVRLGDEDDDDAEGIASHDQEKTSTKESSSPQRDFSTDDDSDWEINVDSMQEEQNSISQKEIKNISLCNRVRIPSNGPCESAVAQHDTAEWIPATDPHFAVGITSDDQPSSFSTTDAKAPSQPHELPTRFPLILESRKYNNNSIHSKHSAERISDLNVLPFRHSSSASESSLNVNDLTSHSFPSLATESTDDNTTDDNPLTIT